MRGMHNVQEVDDRAFSQGPANPWISLGGYNLDKTQGDPLLFVENLEDVPRLHALYSPEINPDTDVIKLTRDGQFDGFYGSVADVVRKYCSKKAIDDGKLVTAMFTDSAIPLKEDDIEFIEDGSEEEDVVKLSDSDLDDLVVEELADTEFDARENGTEVLPAKDLPGFLDDKVIPLGETPFENSKTGVFENPYQEWKNASPVDIAKGYATTVFEKRDELGLSMRQFSRRGRLDTKTGRRGPSSEQVRYFIKGVEGKRNGFVSRDYVDNAVQALFMYDSLVKSTSEKKLNSALDLARQYFTRDAREKAVESIQAKITDLRDYERLMDKGGLNDLLKAADIAKRHFSEYELKANQKTIAYRIKDKMQMVDKKKLSKRRGLSEVEDAVEFTNQLKYVVNDYDNCIADNSFDSLRGALKLAGAYFTKEARKTAYSAVKCRMQEVAMGVGESVRNGFLVDKGTAYQAYQLLSADEGSNVERLRLAAGIASAYAGTIMSKEEAAKVKERYESACGIRLVNDSMYESERTFSGKDPTKRIKLVIPPEAMRSDRRYAPQRAADGIAAA